MTRASLTARWAASAAAGQDQSVFAERERARFVNENEITLQPPAAPAPEGWSPGPWAIVTGTRTRQTRPGNEDQ